MSCPQFSIKPLKWGYSWKPNEHCRYDHCWDSTGMYRIEWKSWEDVTGYTIHRDGYWIGGEHTLDLAKARAQQLHEEWVRQWLTQDQVASTK